MVSNKEVQTNLHKTITWTKKYGKGRAEWDEVRVEMGLASRKLKTPMKIRFANKVVFFQVRT